MCAHIIDAYPYPLPSLLYRYTYVLLHIDTSMSYYIIEYRIESMLEFVCAMVNHNIFAQ
jgi:hypothetical protein